MTFKVGDGKKDAGRESKEWKMKRVEKAFEVAKRIKKEEREKQRREGKEPKKGPSGIGDLADYLMTVEKKKLDKMIEEDLRKAQEAVAAKASATKKRVGALGAKSLESLAKGFKAYLERKKDSSSPEKPEKDTSKQNQSGSTKPSFKGVMKDAHKIRKKHDTSDGKKPLGELKKIKTAEKKDSVKDMKVISKKLRAEIEKSKKRTGYIEFDKHGAEKQGLKKLRESLEKSKDELERNLYDQIETKNAHEKLRIGVVDNRVYFWKVDRTPNDMLNVWGDRYFYFKEHEFKNLV
ncbi:MAG: hypothetical protein ACW98Y_21885, partial [Candidatus Thorarchaeota archaeon]